MAQLAWYQKLLADAAGSILRSEEMQNAVVNTRISEEQLVESVVSEAPKLICGEALILVESISPRDALPSLFFEMFSALARAVWARPKRAVVVIALAGLVGGAVVVTGGWVSLGFLACALGLWVLGLRATVTSRRLNLDAASNQILREQVLAPFLR